MLGEAWGIFWGGTEACLGGGSLVLLWKWSPPCGQVPLHAQQVERGPGGLAGPGQDCAWLEGQWGER